MPAMNDPCSSHERRRNLWAPWRSEYIEALCDGGDDCFLCRYRDNPADDADQLVVYRRDPVFVVMNRFPYTGGHLLVAPLAHVASLDDLDDAALTALLRGVRDCQHLLARVERPDGYNVGINFGHCAGAGLPGHLHVHVVPRWAGDTNFMSVVGDVRVVPKALDAVYNRLRAAATELGLRA